MPRPLPPVIRPHPYLQGDDGRCATCDLPEHNRHHVQAAPDEVGHRILGEREGEER